MITILSPARNIRPSAPPLAPVTTPEFIDETLHLVQELRQYSPWELETILKTTPKLAMNAFQSYQDFDKSQNGSPVIFTYAGLVYRNLDAVHLSDKALAYGFEHLRILSALYGVLKPCDGILPYRLELMSKLKVDGKNLYRYWQDKIHTTLFRTEEPVLSLCSGEFEKAVIPHLRPNDKFITCKFLENRYGKLDNSVVAIKAARGQMARFVLNNTLANPDDVKLFNWDGYAFSHGLSHSSLYVFVKQ